MHQSRIGKVQGTCSNAGGGKGKAKRKVQGKGGGEGGDWDRWEQAETACRGDKTRMGLGF